MASSAGLPLSRGTTTGPTTAVTTETDVQAEISGLGTHDETASMQDPENVCISSSVFCIVDVWNLSAD
jgi:hypothetical protein